MLSFAALDKLNASAKMIDHFLIEARIPPLGGEVKLATRHHDPERSAKSGLFHLAHPRFFDGSQMDITTKCRQRNAHVQLLFQVLREAVNEVIRSRITLVD